MNEKQLIKNGFNKIYMDDVTMDEWYFVFNFPNNSEFYDQLALITNSNLESKGKYIVEFYDTMKYQFTKITQVKRFITLMNEIKVK